MQHFSGEAAPQFNNLKESEIGLLTKIATDDRVGNKCFIARISRD
jgi:hypothetical protein